MYRWSWRKLTGTLPRAFPLPLVFYYSCASRGRVYANAVKCCFLEKLDLFDERTKKRTRTLTRVTTLLLSINSTPRNVCNGRKFNIIYIPCLCTSTLESMSMYHFYETYNMYRIYFLLLNNVYREFHSFSNSIKLTKLIVQISWINKGLFDKIYYTFLEKLLWNFINVNDYIDKFRKPKRIFSKQLTSY